jgi:predicted dehydrogenase
MIRLAVLGAERSRWQAIASRLRGAVLVDAPASGSDAAVVFAAPLEALQSWLVAGKPVLIAIPPAAKKLQELTATPNVAIANPDRFLPSRQLIRQQLDAGKLGDPGLIRIHRWEAGALNGEFVRDLDLILWYFGAEPNVVHAVGHARGTQIHLGFPGGGMAMLEHASVPAGDAYYSLSLIGASGAAYIDDHANMQLVFRGDAPRAVRTDEGISQWSALVQAFADRVAGKSEPNVFPAWPRVLKLADAVDASLAAGQAVAWKGVP